MNGKFSLSMLNYGVEVTAVNRSLDFQIVSMGIELNATLRIGLYSLTSLTLEIGRALREVDPSNTYTVLVNRTFFQESRISISTSGGFLSLLFLTGSRTASNCAALLGFPVADQTGDTDYLGTSGAGLIILPGYPPQELQPLGSIIDGKQSQNETTGGRIEIVSFASFNNFEFKFKWILEGSADYLAFAAFNAWILRGGPIEFTDDIDVPNVFAAGIPLNMRPPLMLKRMVPSLYDYFETPLFHFRELT